MVASPTRHQDGVVEIEQDLRPLRGEFGAGAILGGDGPQPQGTGTPARGLRKLQLRLDLGPGIDRVPGEARVHVTPAIDRGDPEGVGEAVEAERPRQADDMATIDDAPA